MIRSRFASLIISIINRIYVLLFLFFLADLLLMEDGHYYELNVFALNGFTVVMTPRLITYFLLMCFFLIRFLFRKKITFSYFDKGTIFILLLIWATCSFFIGYINNGFSSSFSDFKTFLLLLVPFPIYDMIKSKLISIKTIYYFTFFLLFSATIVLLGFYFYQLVNGYSGSYMRWIFGSTQNYFVSQYINLDFREGVGVVHSSLYYSSVFSVLTLFLICFSNNFFKTKLKWCLLFPVAIFFFAVIQSSTKGYILFLVVSIVFLGVYFLVGKIKHQHSIGKRFFTKNVGLLFIIFVISISVFLIVLANYVNIVRLFDFTNKSTMDRLEFIKESLVLILKPPILSGKGLGVRIYSSVLGNYKTTLEISLLDVFVKQGLIGFLLWIVPLLFAILEIRRGTLMSPKTKIILFVIPFAVYFISLFNPHLCNVGGITMLSLFFSFSDSIKADNIRSISSPQTSRFFHYCVNSESFLNEQPAYFSDLLISLKKQGFSHIVFYTSFDGNLSNSSLNVTFNQMVCCGGASNVCCLGISNEQNSKSSFSFSACIIEIKNLLPVVYELRNALSMQLANIITVILFDSDSKCFNASKNKMTINPLFKYRVIMSFCGVKEQQIRLLPHFVIYNLVLWFLLLINKLKMHKVYIARRKNDKKSHTLYKNKFWRKKA